MKNRNRKNNKNNSNDPSNINIKFKFYTSNNNYKKPRIPLQLIKYLVIIFIVYTIRINSRELR